VRRNEKRRPDHIRSDAAAAEEAQTGADKARADKSAASGNAPDESTGAQAAELAATNSQ
jgi:hypothetical protein